MVGICVILKGHWQLSAFGQFESEGVNTAFTMLNEPDAIPLILSNIQRRWEKRVPFVYFVLTVPRTEYMIPALCDQIQGNFVVLETESTEKLDGILCRALQLAS